MNEYEKLVDSVPLDEIMHISESGLDPDEIVVTVDDEGNIIESTVEEIEQMEDDEFEGLM